MICSSEYDKRIVLQELSAIAENEHGEVDRTSPDSWTDYHSPFAKVTSRGGREFWKSDHAAADVSHVWECPYDPETAAATPRMRVVYESQVFEIVSVIDVDLAHERVQIATKMEV